MEGMRPDTVTVKTSTAIQCGYSQCTLMVAFWPPWRCGWSSYTAKSCLWFYGKNLSTQELKNPERVSIPQSSPERAAIIVEYVFLIQLESTRNKAAPTYIVHLFYSIASQSFSACAVHACTSAVKNSYVATCNIWSVILAVMLSLSHFTMVPFRVEVAMKLKMEVRFVWEELEVMFLRTIWNGSQCTGTPTRSHSVLVNVTALIQGMYG